MNKLNWIVAFVLAALMSSSPCFGQEWAVTYGGDTGREDVAYSVKQTMDGGYVVAGRTDSFGAYYYDFWVLKLDAGGNVTWQKRYSQIGSNRDHAYSIQQTTDGGFVVAGCTASLVDDLCSDFWVLKLDGDGNVTWQKRYDDSDLEAANSIQQTSDGGYVVAGYGQPLSGSPGSGNLWVLKLDDLGNVTWQKKYGGTDTEIAHSIQQTSDGGYVVAGCTHSFGVGESDVWVLKLDGSGEVTWQKTYGGPGPDDAYSVQQTTDGGYIVAGSEWEYRLGPNQEHWILKLDDFGNVTWQKTFGAFGDPRSIQQTTDGGYIIAGGTSSFSQTCEDFLLLKLDASGEIFNCGLCGTTDATVLDSSAAVKDTTVTPWDTFANPVDTSASVQNTLAFKFQICGEGPSSINSIVPDHGPYGRKIRLKGGMFGAQPTGMIGQQEGFYNVATFSGTQTLVGTEFPLWSDLKVKIRIQNLFIDEDGDFLQDGNEASLPAEQIPLEDYTIVMNTLRFEDLNSNGVYDEEDSIIAIDTSNPQLFTLADEPGISALVPGSTPASEPGIPAKVRIRGLNFGEPQGASILHIGGRSWSAGHQKIKIWEDDKIKFKVPNYVGHFPKYKEVWVTVNGKDSNKVWLTITAP